MLVLHTVCTVTHYSMRVLGLSIDMSLSVSLCVTVQALPFQRWQRQIAMMVYVNPCHVTVT